MFLGRTRSNRDTLVMSLEKAGNFPLDIEDV